MPKDYYNTLGVDKTATQDEIKKAFRKKAHEFHPDKKGGDEQKFKELNEAYQILGNADKRKQYDQFGDAAFAGQGFGGTGMGWDDFMRAASAQGGQAGGFNINIDDLGDIFGGIGDMFGFSTGGSRRRRRGNDIQTQLEITFKEAVFGTTKDVQLYTTVACASCKGNGAEPGTPIEHCKTCNGQGAVMQVQRTILGSFQARSTCPDCRGEGKKAAKQCRACGGGGLTRERVKLSLNIPAGIDDGQTIKLAGQGEAASGGVNGLPRHSAAEAGDLYVTVRVRPEPGFERDGDNIHTHAEISFAQTALGDNISVATLESPVTLKIPAGTQSGTVFRLRGKGANSLHGRGRGDLLVHVAVRTPKKLSRAQRKLYEELKALG